MDETQHAQVHFPAGRQFALTWGIPDDFGGMTSALLHRSRAIVRLAGKPVDLLTFDARPDYPSVDAALRARGELIDGVTLINLWDWFRDNDLAPDAPAHWISRSIRSPRSVSTPRTSPPGAESTNSAAPAWMAPPPSRSTTTARTARCSRATAATSTKKPLRASAR